VKALAVPAVRLLRALPLAVAAGFGAYGLLNTAGLLGAVLLVVTLLLALALAGLARGGDPASRALMRRTATAALLCAPALLVVFFSFSSGGFFPDSVAIGALAVAVVLVARLALAQRPLASFGRGAIVPLVGLAGFAGWALLSQVWSHAPGRATISFDRDLLYLLTFALFASVGRTRARVTWAVRGLALVMAAVAAVALLSRVAPDVLAAPADPASGGRLAYPLTYWNALGVSCAIAAVLCLHLAAGDDRRGIRVFGAGALPVIATTLLLTYSRGGLAVAVVGLVAYAVLGRPRGLLAALIAAAPGIAVAMKIAYDSTLLSGSDPTSPAAVHQGHHLALVVLACVVSAVVLRTALLPLDRLLERERSPTDRHRRALTYSASAAVVAALAVALALGAPGAIAHRWNEFVNQQTPNTGSLVRNRLSSSSNDGRIGLWTIAMNAFDAHPIDGTGAETYEVLYYEHRTATAVVVNAHSLYIETLAELGVVGLAFLALYVLGTLVGLAPFRRGRDRALYAALFSAGLAWAIHAGVDWDWQMPAVSLPFAALGGLALGRRPKRRGRTSSMSASLRASAVGAAIVALAVLPALVLASQVRLSEATNAYAAGNCASAQRLAESSIAALGTRAGPWQIEALCSVQSGHFGRAATQFRRGLVEDPKDWQLQAGLAAAIAASGSDARSQAALALELNPLDPTVSTLAAALAHGPSRRARTAAIAFLSDQSLIESG